MAYTTIDNGKEYFDTTLWTGNGSASGPTVSSLEFKPQFLWSKRRDATANNYIYDTVRHNSDSPNKFLNTNNTDAEQVFNAFTLADNGFTLATDNVYFNADGGTYVGWCWKGGTTSSNSDGSITSSVQANTTAGFSIVTYAGNSGSSATIGHGLGVAPNAVIVKARNNSSGWPYQVNGTYGLRLNSSGANDTSNGNVFFANTAPTSSVFSVGGSDETNDNYNYVAYCFANIKGYCQVSSYIGNGSTDGPFAYTGFRPAWILFKRSDSSDGGEWKLIDSTRMPLNWTCNALLPDSNAAENTSELQSTYGTDFLSNGFKIRASHGAFNTSGGTYTYIAIAENPFVSSKGIPVTAR